MIYPNTFEQKIGFDAVRKEISKLCVSTLGITHCNGMKFSCEYDVVLVELRQTNEFLSILQSGKDFPTDHIIDVRPYVKAISVPGTHLSAQQLFELSQSLVTIGQIISFFKSSSDNSEASPYPELVKLASQMQPFTKICDTINRILDKFGNVKDNASPALKDLRAQLYSLNSSINSTMRRVVSRGVQDGYLEPSTTPAVRDGRLVLPVAGMNKRKLRGVVHDESASGKTIFIEPEEIVETNNRIREAEVEISREIIRILTKVTEEIRPFVPDLLATYHLLGQIDFIRAKALYANDVNAQMPHLERDCQLEWYHAIHPVLYMALQAQGKEVVPQDITLNKDNRILVISGPNAGGKSVCLKTVGIIQYMTQCGVLPTVYDNSHVGVFSSMFIDIGDQQSIEDDLSTYSSHLMNMKMLLNHSDEKTLVLIDEFGSGTEPQIGGAIAQAILSQLNGNKAYGVITTHYGNLKHFAEETDGLVNGAMLFDRQHIKPLFQLSIGYPGSSFALEIAQNIGLPAMVIEQAKQLVGSEYVNMDKYLLDIARDRRYWANKRKEIHDKQKRLDKVLASYDDKIEQIDKEKKIIINEAKNEAQEIINRSNAAIENTIREIKQAQADKDKTKQARKQLATFKQDVALTKSKVDSRLEAHKVRTRKKTTKAVNSKPEHDTIKTGDNVLLDGGNTVGQVISIDGKNAIVAFGNIKTKVALNKLKKTLRQAVAQQVTPVSAETSNSIRTRQLEFKPEIDVRGMRANEAVQAVTYFIDDALQFGIGTVRVLHGTGTGALREAIRQYLATVPGVKSYRDEHVQLGGAGITVVELS